MMPRCNDDDDDDDDGHSAASPFGIVVPSLRSKSMMAFRVAWVDRRVQR